MGAFNSTKNYKNFGWESNGTASFPEKIFENVGQPFWIAVPEKWKPTEHKPVPFETEISENSNRKVLVNGKRSSYLILFEGSCRPFAPA